MNDGNHDIKPGRAEAIRPNENDAQSIIGYSPDGGCLIRGRYWGRQGMHLEPLSVTDSLHVRFLTSLDMKVFGVAGKIPVLVVYSGPDKPGRRYLTSRTDFIRVPDGVDDLGSFMAERLAEGRDGRSMVVPVSRLMPVSPFVENEFDPRADVVGYSLDGTAYTGSCGTSRGWWVEPLRATDEIFFEPSNELDRMVLGCAESELVMVVWSAGTERYRLSRPLSFHCLSTKAGDHVEEQLREAAESRYGPDDEEESQVNG